MSKADDLHAIVLASEEDHSLKLLTEALGEVDTSKQFASIAGGGSLLQQTVARYVSQVPAERMVVVVTSAQEAVARAQLREWPGIDLIARPEASGGGLDLLLSLGRVFSRSPGARVVVTPADRYVPRPRALVNAVVAASKALDQAAVILVGVAGRPRIGGQAWIVPGRPLGRRIHSVARLEERASPERAAQLAAAGALRDTSTVVARVEHLWYLAARQLPMQAEAVACLWAGRPSLASAVATACLDMPAIQLNGALLRGAKDLAVIPVRGSGWTEWTSAQDVIDSLEDRSEQDLLLSRILARQRTSGRTELRRRVQANSGHATAA
jgi:mannose-1-phosphate guanylyltransferase